MNEYSSLVMGFGFFAVCFVATLAHIRWTKKQAARKALSTPQKAEFLFKTEGGEDSSAGSASLAHR